MASRPDDSLMTDWSMILDAAGSNQGVAADATERLVRRYWPAVYAYIRSTGRDVHEASDLTQGFVCDVVLRRQLAKAADPKRGRFRNLLMTSLKNFLGDVHRHRMRQKRLPKGAAVLPLSEMDLAGIAASEMATNSAASVEDAGGPEAAFNAQWSAMLVRRVLEQVQASCEASGLLAHWQVFEGRVARPLLRGDEPVPYAELVEKLQLESASHAANLMVAVKRRFAKALFEAICETVGDRAEAEDELLSLLRDLERS